MEKEYFVQQEAFMEDYQQLAAQKDVMIESLADKIISQLNQTQEDYYEMPAEESKDGVSHRFPFSRRIYSDENDGTLNTEYTYEGEPYILQTEDDF